MKGYYYYEVIRKMIIQFLDAFNDIQVKRLQPDSSTVRELIHVPVKLSVKEKFWYWLQERKDDEVLPMITAWLTTIDYASDRQVNSFFDLCSSTDPDSGSYEKFPHPVPYNFTFTMNIWSLYLSDIDQILEQILPFFAPHIFIRVRLDELNIEYDVKVVFQSCTPELSLDMGDEEYRVVNYTLDFVVQAWLFKPAVTSDDLIKCIYTTYYPASATPIIANADTTTTFTSGASGGGEQTSLCGYYDDDGQLICNYEVFPIDKTGSLSSSSSSTSSSSSSSLSSSSSSSSLSSSSSSSSLSSSSSSSSLSSSSSSSSSLSSSSSSSSSLSSSSSSSSTSSSSSSSSTSSSSSSTSSSSSSSSESVSGFTPTGTPYAWYSADSLELNDDDSVTSWTDLSGNNYHLTTGNAPTFKTGIQNTLPAVYFNNNYLEYNWPDISQPNTYFIVYRLVDTTNGAIFSGYNDTAKRNYLFVEGNIIKIYAGALYNGPAPDTDTHVITARFNGVNSFIRLDGVSSGNANASGQVSDGFTLAANWDGGNRKEIYIMEVIAYNGAEDPTGNEAGLAAKWGL